VPIAHPKPKKPGWQKTWFLSRNPVGKKPGFSAETRLAKNLVSQQKPGWQKTWFLTPIKKPGFFKKPGF
jgi:hypothetical protein